QEQNFQPYKSSTSFGYIKSQRHLNVRSRRCTILVKDLYKTGCTCMMNSDWRGLMNQDLTSHIQVSLSKRLRKHTCLAKELLGGQLDDLSYAVKHNYKVGFQSIMGMKNYALRA